MRRSPKKTGARGHVREISLNKFKVSEKAQKIIDESVTELQNFFIVE